MVAKKVVILLVLLFMISGCAPKIYREIQHPVFGKITTDDPRFEQALTLCTQEIYPNGVTVYGEYFPTAAAALSKFGGIIKNPEIKRQILNADANDPNSVFIDEVIKTRVSCVEAKGFKYGEIRQGL